MSAVDGVACILPARLESQRLDRKVLREIAGRTLLEWSWRRAGSVSAFDEVLVATDSEEIVREVEDFGGQAVVTSSRHGSGTDRVAEAAANDPARSFPIVVNYQADEPFVDPETLTRAVERVRDGSAQIATLAAPLGNVEEWHSPAVVKVVRRRDGRALYFSRAPIPRPREGPPPLPTRPGGDETAATPYLRHVGVYVYRREALLRWVELPASRLEEIERLEQLRALEDGMEIHVEVGPWTEPGVDLPEDLERARRVLGG